MKFVTGPQGAGKWEVVRRLRYGALMKLFRHRYGHEFPDDDAGRDDLFVLLCVVSLAPSASDLKIAHTIEMWAPWMQPDEREMLVEHVNRLTIYERMPAAKELGERLNLTNAERERLRLWPIKPVDMTVEQLMEQKKFKRREQEKQRQRARGVQPRESYLASARPWEAEGIPRSTWYYRQRWTGSLPVKTSPLPTIVTKAARELSNSRAVESQQEGLQGSVATVRPGEQGDSEQVERLKPRSSLMSQGTCPMRWWTRGWLRSTIGVRTRLKIIRPISTLSTPFPNSFLGRLRWWRNAATCSGAV
jgi:hypothetical protein